MLRPVSGQAWARSAGCVFHINVAVASTPAEYKAFLARDLKVQGERVKTSDATLD